VARTSAATPASVLTIHAHEIATNFTYVPIGSLIGSKSKYTQGDFFVGNDVLQNAKNGVAVGHDEYACLYTDISTWEEVCPDYASIFMGAGDVAAGTIYVGSLFHSPLSGAGPDHCRAEHWGDRHLRRGTGNVPVQAADPTFLDDTFTLTKL
jgi:hypothetical protein